MKTLGTFEIDGVYYSLIRAETDYYLNKRKGSESETVVFRVKPNYNVYDISKRSTLIGKFEIDHNSFWTFVPKKDATFTSCYSDLTNAMLQIFKFLV